MYYAHLASVKFEHYKAYKGYCQSVFSLTGYILTNFQTPVRDLKIFKLNVPHKCLICRVFRKKAAPYLI